MKKMAIILAFCLLAVSNLSMAATLGVAGQVMQPQADDYEAYLVAKPPSDFD